MIDVLPLDGSPLTPAEVAAVARDYRSIALTDDAREAMRAAREVVDDTMHRADAVYGINTGFGSLSRHRIAPDGLRHLQRNLLRSHAAGVGEPLDPEVVRAMMAVQAASLARGHSGARPLVVDRIGTLLETGIVPWVPSRGSVGASGDLAPLAHASLALIGEGAAWTPRGPRPIADLLSAAGIEPLELEAKEGLALINGTHLMTGIAALAMHDIDHLIDAALGAAAMAMDACRATDSALDPRVHAVRRQPGQIDVAARLRALLAGSEILTAHAEGDPRVQDPYCLRACPQVIGAALDALDHVRGAVERELGAVTDNPLVFPHEGDIISGGNFHGMPMAIALDLLPIALTHIAGIAERRVYWLLSARDTENPVPPYLSPIPGLQSGLMIVQYTAAACCNELQTLSAPASVGNISTAAGIEDYNSMGATSAHQARAAVRLARSVIAIELLVMAEGLEFQRPLRSGAAVERVAALIREVVAPLTIDRSPHPDIAAIEALIAGGAFSDVVRNAKTD